MDLGIIVGCSIGTFLGVVSAVLIIRKVIKNEPGNY